MGFDPPGGGVSDHGALTGLADDDHTIYQLRSEKGAASGYAPLDSGLLVPASHLASSGTADATTFLRGDRAWSEAPGAVGAWQIPTFQNGWANLGSGYQSARYRAEGEDQVRVEGVATGGSATGSIVFTLAAGYRPVARRIFATDQATNAHASLEIRDTGEVLTRGGGTPNYLSLECSFTTS